MRNMTADEIAEYIDIKLEETTEDDVFPFNAQLVTDEFPVMVKFHEVTNICMHKYEHVWTCMNESTDEFAVMVKFHEATNIYMHKYEHVWTHMDT